MEMALLPPCFSNNDSTATTLWPSSNNRSAESARSEFSFIEEADDRTIGSVSPAISAPWTERQGCASLARSNSLPHRIMLFRHITHGVAHQPLATCSGAPASSNGHCPLHLPPVLRSIQRATVVVLRRG